MRFVSTVCLLLSAKIANSDCPFDADTCLQEKSLLFLKARWEDVVVHG